MQIMVHSDLSSLLASLQIARRMQTKRGDLINSNCATEAEIVMAQAWAFHNLFPADGSPPDTLRHKGRLAKFRKNNCIIRLAKDGNVTKGGYMLLDGELMAFHNYEHGKGNWMMEDAVHFGASKLSCFDEPALVQLYKRHGFRVLDAQPNTTPGGPSVLLMGL